MKLIHLGTIVQTRWQAIDDDGDAVGEPIVVNANIPKLQLNLFGEACRALIEKQTELREQAAKLPAPETPADGQTDKLPEAATGGDTQKLAE